MQRWRKKKKTGKKGRGTDRWARGVRERETVEQRLTQIHKAQVKRFEEKKQQMIQAGDEKAEPNPWLRRVGWAEHLRGLDSGSAAISRVRLKSMGHSKYCFYIILGITFNRLYMLPHDMDCLKLCRPEHAGRRSKSLPQLRRHQ